MSLIVTSNPFQNPLHGAEQQSVLLNMRNLNLVMGVVLQRRLNGWGKEGRRGQDPGSRWDNEVHGAIGEAALAQYLKVWWDGGTAGVYSEADVGDLQVKGTDWHDGHLLVHKDSADGEVFVLATCKHLPWVELRGWLFGVDCKQPSFWKELQKGRPCFAVPIDQLHSMNVIPTKKT